MQDKRLKIETNLSNQELDLLGNLEISFKTAPLKFFDSSKVQFTNEKYEPVTGYRFKRTSYRLIFPSFS